MDAKLADCLSVEESKKAQPSRFRRLAVSYRIGSRLGCITSPSFQDIRYAFRKF
jgi:hypothetical protein